MSEYSILELPLITEPWQADELLKKMDCARKIYNDMLSHNLKKYKEMIKTKKWRALNSVIAEELKASAVEEDGAVTGKKKPKRKKSERLKAAYDEKNKILRENGFSEFDFISQSMIFSKYYQKHISSNMASLSVASPMWSAFDKLLFGNGERVSFKKTGDLPSLASNNKSGIRFVGEAGKYTVILSNKNAKARPVILPVIFPGTEYEKELLDGDLKKIIKVTRICHKVIKGKDKFFVQLTIAKPPAIKYFEDGALRHPVGTGKVGVAVWRDELYAVSGNKVYRASLVPCDETEFLEKRTVLTRCLENLRRASNQQNYDSEGKIKKGIIGADGRRKRLKWHFSNNYYKVKTELQELYRVHDVAKEQLQRKIVWDLLSMGDNFVFADTSFITEKPEYDEENPLPNAEYKKKKARRRSIQENAPSSLLNRLSLKISTIVGGEINKKKLPEELYWYQHDRGVSDKSLFAGDFIKVAGEVVPHTAYRSFLIRHFDTSVSNVYDQKALAEEFDKFVENLTAIREL